MLIMTHMDKVSNQGTGVEVPIQWWRGSGASNNNENILIVNNPELLMLAVLPTFCFPQTSFESFARKMYRWGFRRAKIPGYWAFECCTFRRGDFVLLSLMVNVDSGSRKPKISAPPDTPVTASESVCVVERSTFAKRRYPAKQPDSHKPVMYAPQEHEERPTKLARTDSGGAALRDKIGETTCAFNTERYGSSSLYSNRQPSAGLWTQRKLAANEYMGRLLLETNSESRTGMPCADFPPHWPIHESLTRTLENQEATILSQHTRVQIPQQLDIPWSRELSTTSRRGLAELTDFLVAENCLLQAQVQPTLLVAAGGSAQGPLQPE
jgi:HSF-type DNA-binding